MNQFVNNTELTSTHIIWIIWEKQQRGRALSAYFKIPYIELVFKKKGIQRYLSSIYHTITIISKVKPKVVMVTNPSIILNSLALLLRPIFGFRLIVDFHNAGLFPLEGNRKLIQRYANWLVRKADFSIVTNMKLASYVKELKGKPIVLPDALPSMKHKSSISFTDKTFFNVILVRGGGRDEPNDLINELIHQLQGSNIKLFITGRQNNAIIKNENTVMTGFLNDEDYNKLMSDVDVVLVLSNRSDNLMCGAYEAVSLERPLIASDSEVIRWYFNRGTIFTSNSASDIIEGIRTIEAQKIWYNNEITLLKQEISYNWPKFANELKRQLIVEPK